MTKFEEFLIEKGYIKLIFNCKTMLYELAKNHTISTMVNLNHIYIHKDDLNLEQLNNKECKTKSRMITFGLNEVGKPATLIFPRPKITWFREMNGINTKQCEVLDDVMNTALLKLPFEMIYEVMFDKNQSIEMYY